MRLMNSKKKNGKMNRRESIQAGATLFFAGFIGAEAFLSSCQSSDKEISFSKGQKMLLNEIAEIIIPATKKSPGAKAANIAEFMQSIVFSSVDVIALLFILHMDSCRAASAIWWA